MADTPTVLVTGATGTVGSALCESLAGRDCTGRDCEVRALVRNPETAGGLAGAEPVRFDFEKPETWGRAFEGGDRMFLVRPPQISRVGEHLLPAVDAAARCGVEHVTLLSVLGAGRNPLLPHRRIETHLLDADLTHTFLRASFFMQNLDEVHAVDVCERDELFVPAGGGTTSFVDARDVADCAAVTLLDPGHAGAAYDITGPEALTYGEVAAVFSAVLGREVTYPDPSVLAFVRRMRERGYDLGFLLAMVVIYTTTRLGLAGRVSDDAAALLGREPRSLRTYVEDYREEFAPASREVTDP
jgi:uncharacterized protein YbjT (DUF2867 family)